jgi:NADH-quinone oxidoreductase subunit C
MEALEQIKARLEMSVPGIRVEMLLNRSPANQSSLLIDREHFLAAATLLRDDPAWRFDYASNVTGVDWLDRTEQKTVLVKQVEDGIEQEFEQSVEETMPGYLEVVYHLYSMALKHGPLVIRVRTVNRSDQTRVPSLTPIYRGAEFQEREIYDLYGVVFEGHPDLRRLLMWEEFTDHPMRKDYVEADDFEYEPTPHGAVLEKAKQHYPREESHG